MRRTAIPLVLALLVTGALYWRHRNVQQERLVRGVHLLAVDKFAPVVRPWLQEHGPEFGRPIVVEYVHAKRFRWFLQQPGTGFDGYLVDVYGGAANRLRADGEVRAYYGGPLKLVVRGEPIGVGESMPLIEAWRRLDGRVIGIAPADTPLGLDTRAWLDEAGLSTEIGVEESPGPTPRLEVFASTGELQDALASARCDAAILRAEFEDGPDASAWAWHRLDGRPEDHLTLGLVVRTGTEHGELLRRLWMKLQPVAAEAERTWRTRDAASE